MTDVLKALSDPHRQSILKMLAHQEMGACEIIHSIGLSQPAVSHHLKILRQARLITSQKQGKMVFYSLNKSGLKNFFNQINCFLHELSCFNDAMPKPSQLRQNPDLCESLGFKAEVCEKEV
ncbi:MAG: winged helix-turn-helix transcriptional regulator [Pelotomaculum sp.]|nr:winged helix-turn-helix transcriptional regulator [Pelotomaculum sp.]